MKLTIPTPCAKNWDAMTPTACGRFCNVCQKEVIDVTQMEYNIIIQNMNTTATNFASAVTRRTTFSFQDICRMPNNR